MPKRKPGAQANEDVNTRFGRRLRKLREDAGQSQSDLGEALGVTFQQIQKYENGTTSISLNRLEELASRLRVPIINLLEGVEQSFASGFAENEQAPFEYEEDRLMGTGVSRKQKVALLQAFNRLENAKVRRSLVTLVEAMVSSDNDG